MNSNYEKNPKILISADKNECLQGWETLGNAINDKLSKSGGKLVVIETYQGVDLVQAEAAIKRVLKPHKIYNSHRAFKSVDKIKKLVAPYVTDDEVFGYMSDLTLENFFEPLSCIKLNEEVKAGTGYLQVIIGPGASLCAPKADLLIYMDMTRWEIQLRMRKNIVGNLGVVNENEDFTLRYKQSFFVDWRVLDKHKLELFKHIDFFIDTNNTSNPKMLSGESLNQSLIETTTRPFRLVPFFDPGPWGGQWLKEVVDLDRDAINYAWGFDCVPEENSLLFDFGGVSFESPAINLVLTQPKPLLGERVFKQFGAEFPIRFDFLDTVEGGNLSLQVHPTKEYIKEKFGMPYTQDESYYIMDVKDKAEVYLGIKDETQPEKMICKLKDAQEKGQNFDADSYVKKWPVKKHDHFLIPSGTVHCSGKNSVVLEISATPYIFTFKLWDWGRLDLDGKQRPINIEHGEKVIDWTKREKWIKENLINQIEEVARGDGWREERTGLHPSGFIETRRHWFTKKVLHHTGGSVNVINLVEGREVMVESPEEKFEPFVIHYAETFIIPAAVGNYTIRPNGESIEKQCVTLKAYVRDNF